VKEAKTVILCEGRRIPETVDELVDPAHTAYVIVDLQNDFCKRGGSADATARQRGQDIEAIYQPTIDWSRKLLAAARASRVRIVHIQNTAMAHRATDSAARLKFMMRAYGVTDPAVLPEYTLEGTWGHEIIPDLAPQPTEFVVKKHTSSSFVGTRLDTLLRINNIQTVVLVGGVTEGCVESAARDACHHGYFVVVCEDAVCSFNPDLHEAALKVMRRRYEVIPAAAVLRVWEAKVGARSQPTATVRGRS
jgi:ureidoacrylate peracid hydrolase